MRTRRLTVNLRNKIRPSSLSGELPAWNWSHYFPGRTNSCDCLPLQLTYPCLQNQGWFSIPFPHILSMIMHVKPRDDKCCVSTTPSLLSRGMLTPNGWSMGSYSRRSSWSCFFCFELSNQFLCSWDTGPWGGRGTIFILSKQASLFIHYWLFVIFPVLSCQGAGIWWWCIPYNSLPQRSPTYHVICIWGTGIIVQVNSIHCLYHRELPQVLHGGPYAWLKYHVFLERISFLYGWQELPPKGERLYSFSNCFVSGTFPRNRCQLLGFTAC